MYKEKIVYSLTCPKHKSFTPNNGAGSVKGGCGTCLWLCEIFEDARVLEERAKDCKNFLDKKAAEKGDI